VALASALVAVDGPGRRRTSRLRRPPRHADLDGMAQPIRVARTKEQARASYDRMARGYDRFARFEDPYRREGLRLLGVRAGESVLELGYGTGTSLVDLATMAGPSGRIAGVDISPGMREVARERLADRGLDDRVDLRVGDAASLVFPDGSFDAVFASFTLELFDTPEIPVVLAEVRRVLRPDGRLGVVAMDMPDKAGLMERLYVQTHKWWPDVVDCRPIPVHAELTRAGYTVEVSDARRMYGLAVGIVVGVSDATHDKGTGRPEVRESARLNCAGGD
jgi:ubiquinone/menaquinone biosynthesis C-methylase UbiE